MPERISAVFTNLPIAMPEFAVLQFVDALTEIAVIRQTAAVELESAADMEHAEQVHREAQEQMIEALESTGLSVDEYNRIATLMGIDPELSERIHSKLQERGCSTAVPPPGRARETMSPRLLTRVFLCIVNTAELPQDFPSAGW